MSKPTITLIGNGKMALSIAKGLSATYAIEVIGRDLVKLEQFEATLKTPIIKTLYSNATIEGKTVILCVKPANLSEIAPKLVGKPDVLYSVLAGTSLESLKTIDSFKYCRAMPNLAAQNALSMTALVGDATLRDEAIKLFSSIGMTLWVESEKELDIATALSGSGPAYLALVAEALCDGAVREGLKRDDAMVLMRGLFKGFGELVSTTHPALLKDSVMSPGGTTAAGYGALEDSNVRNGFMEAIRRAYERAKGMK
ncbi:MAG: pyrroline-5-carboxylate reductase [Sulfuricurvum sp.]|uniref:pyrroline-5-carboxylate reductase n=1 Tax=Sulfuricurvum sp. TaxID=2025608 RepID=UPI002617CF5B|nr:pyrroline-5-carboxylate reductase [Sulfuricurvum sp.]MDD2828260.1 pyrroline-5-carboxylate reductase [Sulfuricurvum sp.]MDD4949785.1 pyrroline-5-carboxylate reductase [Sulfuricurvum sp.]